MQSLSRPHAVHTTIARIRRPRLASTVLLTFVTLCLSTRAFAGDINRAKGFNAGSVYDFSGLDSVNAFNGNLTVSLPIGQTYAAGGGLSYQFVLTANGNIWDSTPDPCVIEPAPTMAIPDRRANAGMGWILTLGRLLDSQCNGANATITSTTSARSA